MYDYSEISLSIASGIGKRILFFPVIDSTNNFLKTNAGNFSPGTVVWADGQTGGRGRRERSWESPSGKGLYFSILLKPPFPENASPVLSLMTSLAVKKAIEICTRKMRLPEKAIEIKWPNDLLISNHKIAGILIESTTTGELQHIIVGIGINVVQTPDDFSPALRPIAGSLKQFYGGEWKREELLKQVLSQFNEAYCAFNPAKVVEDYRHTSSIWGRKCRLENADDTYWGICRDIASSGELIVETEVGLKKFISGSLTLL